MTVSGRRRKNNLRITHCEDCKILLTSQTRTTIGIKRERMMSRCWTCYNKWQKKYRDDRGYNVKIVAANRLKKFGITTEHYNELFKLQFGGCAICKQPEGERQLHVDHNHTTNELRGLLCHSCNISLGMLKEDEDIIWNMLEYIKKYNIKKTA